MVVDLSLRKPGGCTTSLIGIVFGSDLDPGISLRRALLDTWLQLYSENSKQHMLIRTVWHNKTENLSDVHRWSKVSGLLDATIATLLDIGWDPIEADTWITHSMHICHIDALAGNRKDILTAVQEAITHKQQTQASQHYMGEGAEHGFEYNDFKQHYNRLKIKDPLAAGRLLSIGQGAIWTPDRITGKKDFQCPLCGYGGCNWYHLVWACPVINKQDSPNIKATNNLYQFIRHLKHDHYSWWTRGLVGLNHLEDIPPLLIEEEAIECLTYAGARVFESTFGAVKLSPGHFGGTDGSGGKHSRDPMLRRCGCAFVILNMHGDLVFSIRGPIAGLQTVPRAELTALCLLLESTSGFVPVVTDSKYVFDGFHAGPNVARTCNKDLWDRLWAAYRKRVDIIKLDWTPSHKNESSVVSGQIGLWQYLANLLADHMADAAAANFQVDDNVAETINSLFARAASVRRRLVEVHRIWFGYDHSNFKYTEDVHLLQERDVKRARVDVDIKARNNPQSEISTLLAASNHKVRTSTKEWTCIKCWARCDSRTSSIKHFLTGICVPCAVPPWVDASHCYGYSAPWHFCYRCGSHLNEDGPLRYLKLAVPCRPPYQVSWLVSKGIIKPPSRL